MAIVTIGGNPGSGKTTLAVKLAAALGYEELYVGGIFRSLAAERGITVEQLSGAIKDDPALERGIDERQAKLMREKDNLVVQGRVAWFFASHYLESGPIPESAFKIVARQSPFTIINLFLAADPAIGAQRVAERKEDATKSVEEITRATAERVEHDRERYRTLYGIANYLDPKHYSLIFDTSHMTEQEVLDATLLKIRGLLS